MSVETETKTTAIEEATRAALARFAKIADLERGAAKASEDARTAGREARDAQAAIHASDDPATLAGEVQAALARQRAAEDRAAALRAAIPAAQAAALRGADALGPVVNALVAAEQARADAKTERTARAYAQAVTEAAALAHAAPDFGGVIGPGWLHAWLPTSTRQAWGQANGIPLFVRDARPAPSPRLQALAEASTVLRRAEVLANRIGWASSVQDAPRRAVPDAETRPVVTEEIRGGA
ncbi:hypothetical protein [Roseomonas mucosa]|nr:hypothetical protein [Roseomonas mucosa]